jgi:phage tail sheath protein FI
VCNGTADTAVVLEAGSGEDAHKAPVNELIRSIRGFELAISRREQDCEQDILNPQNINVVRAFPGCGNRV